MNADPDEDPDMKPPDATENATEIPTRARLRARATGRVRGRASHARFVFGVACLLASLAAIGCGGAGEGAAREEGNAAASATAGTPGATPGAAELESLRKELAQLGEHVARLERENQAQLGRIKESLARVEGALGAVRASGSAPGASGGSGAESAVRGASRGVRNLAIQFVLLGVIVGAIFFILRLFFGRWGAEGPAPPGGTGAPPAASSPRTGGEAGGSGTARAFSELPPAEESDTPIQTEPTAVPVAAGDEEPDDDDPIPSPLEAKTQ